MQVLIAANDHDRCHGRELSYEFNEMGWAKRPLTSRPIIVACTPLSETVIGQFSFRDSLVKTIPEKVIAVRLEDPHEYSNNSKFTM